MKSSHFHFVINTTTESLCSPVKSQYDSLLYSDDCVFTYWFAVFQVETVK